MYHENQSGKATARNNRCWLYCMPGAVINNQSLSPLHADGVPRVPEQHFPGMLAKLECEVTCTILDEEMNSPLRTQSQPRKWLKCFLQLITCIRSSSSFKTPPILSLSLIILLRCGIGPQTSPPPPMESWALHFNIWISQSSPNFSLTDRCVSSSRDI